MKKRIFLAAALCLLLLAGCVVGGKPSITGSITAADVESLSVSVGNFFSSARDDTRRNVVSNAEDIERILTALNALTIVREADIYEMPFANIIFDFHLTNGENLWIMNNGYFVHTRDGFFLVDASLDAEEF
jgi:hypothetical protein